MNQYAPNFIEEDGCLYELKGSADSSSKHKLCNFAPKLVREISVDDGIGTITRIVLTGTHASGRILPEIEINADELGGFSWLHKLWGIDCILEPGHTVKDKVRYAIQTTSEDIEHTSVYGVTGWKKIDGQWEFLMPGDEERTVSLPSKMQGYITGHTCSELDLAQSYAFLTAKVAPDEVMYPLMAFTFLTPLNHFLRLASCEPKFVLFLTGRTGTRKSTLAALFLSFFGNFNGANLPMSFQDTGNHILHNLFMLKDVLTCVDDYHPATRKAETVMREIFQTVCRAYGDRTGRGRLNADSTPMASRPPQGNAIITGEFLPDVGESGTARYLALELESNAVNLQLLSDVQRYAADGTFRNCMYGYIQWLKQTCLRDAETEARFIEWLGKRFESYRQEFYSKHHGFHGRVTETVAWLQLGMELYLWFLKAELELAEDDVTAEKEKLRSILYKLAEQQAKTIMQDKPTRKFICQLVAMLESERVFVIGRNESVSDKKYKDKMGKWVGCEDETYYYLFAETTLTEVIKFCEAQGESFTIQLKYLLKQMAAEKLISTASGQNTKLVRFGGKQRRVMCLRKDVIPGIVAESA